MKGIRLHTNKNYKQAETLYNKVLLTEPSNYEALRHLGILNQDLEQYEKAYNYFLQAFKINQNGFQVLNNLATIHMLNKNYNLALKCLSQSFKINSNYVPTINNLAGYYHKVNDPKNALYYSQLSLKIQPNNPMALNQHAKALVINNQPEQAIEILEKLNEVISDNDDFKLNLSSAYREMGEIEKANKISSEGFKKDYKKVLYLMGYTKDKNNKLNSEQIAYYDELLKTDKLDFDDKAIVCHSFFEYFKNQKEYKKAGILPCHWQ